MSDNKKSAIVSLVAETHIHSGIGQSTGALDLPVARERTTHYPFVPGSGVKGAFRVWAEERAGMTPTDVDELFGPKAQSQEDGGSELFAGTLLCSDARLVLLPVRCLSDAYKWVTCPAILQRFKRDCERAGVEAADFDLPAFPARRGKYFGNGDDAEVLGLEEREFSRQGDASGIAEAIGAALIPELGTLVKDRLVVVSDTDFTWFARYALPVMTRNALDENKIVKRGALWHEESLAPDTVMYVLLAERNKANKSFDAVPEVTGAMNDRGRYIQIGGNETVGQGWFRMFRYAGANG